MLSSRRIVATPERAPGIKRLAEYALSDEPSHASQRLEEDTSESAPDAHIRSICRVIVITKRGVFNVDVAIPGESEH